MEPIVPIDAGDVEFAWVRWSVLDRLFCALLCASILPLSACRSVPPAIEEVRSRTVSEELAIKPSMAAYPQEKDVKYVLPDASLSNETPTYPDGAPARHASSSVAVKVRLVIDAEGRVTKVHPLDGADQQAKHAYFQSVVAACKKWTFTPLQARKTFVVPDGEVFGAPKVKVITETTNLPFSLDYVFSFSEVVSVQVIPAE